MTNLEKMNQLTSSDATKDQIKNWAYGNRILVSGLEYEEEFETMKKSLDAFMETEAFMETADEFQIWDSFLDALYID